MDFSIKQSRLADIKVQRNALLGACALLLLSNSIQAILLIYRHERIIVAPPQLTQSFWVEGNQFSAQYLEQMALHYAHLILDVTEKNILYQGDIVLRAVTPESYGVFKEKLLSDEKRLQKNNLSTRFSATECKISQETLTVEITGELMSYVADKRISQIHETYQIQFQNQSGRLLINSFSLVKSEKEENT